MPSDIIIQYIDQEIRVAIREESRLKNIYIERPNFRNPVGNIYKGRIIKVMPGMGSAFVNIGIKKAAFLNINDLVINDIDSELLDEEQIKPYNNQQNGKKLLIEELLSEGQDIVVQVSKAPISSKGARITSLISIPGRNVVFLPGANSVSLSRQINDEKVKFRIKKFLKRYRNSGFGLIVRTFGQNSNENDLKTEINNLVKTWSEIEQKSKISKSPTLLFEEPNIILRTVRDNLNNEIDNIIIDDENEFNKLKSYLLKYMPEYMPKLTLYKDKENIFDAYGLSNDLQLLMERKVPLPSGGYLIIDPAEALTSIDVNTGKFVGNESHENTVLQTNLEAVKEIVHQIRLRNIGGIIILDFIDMGKNYNQINVYKAFKDELKKDKAKTKISQITDFGIIEMTRQRTQENINKTLSTNCYCCQGSGLILSNKTTFFSICRELYYLKKKVELPDIIFIYTHPDIVDYTVFKDQEGFEMLKRKLSVKIHMIAKNSYHPAQYKISSLPNL